MQNGTRPATRVVDIIHWCTCGKTVVLPPGITEEQLEAFLATRGNSLGMTRIRLAGTIGLIGTPVTLDCDNRLFVILKDDLVGIHALEGWAADMMRLQSTQASGIAIG